MRRALLHLALSAPLVAALPIWAGPTVVFTDGRSLRVDGVEREGETALLYMEGGGALVVPAERVENWHELPLGLEPPAPEEEMPLGTIGPAGAEWRGLAGEFADLIAGAAERHELDPVLLTALAQVESAFDPRAVSPKGARGLLQLMPATADRFGVVDAFDAGENVEGGARYLRWLLERYGGRTDLALAGYNAGEGAVDRFSGIPPYRETRHYVRQVLARVESLGEAER